MIFWEYEGFKSGSIVNYTKRWGDFGLKKFNFEISELARQLNDADLDTQSELNYRIEQFNSLTDQLITVNQRLLRSTSLSRQQPDLLNTRDKLLADMSELLRISVNESSNGVVDVNIGQGSNSVSVLTGGSNLT